MVLRLLKSRPVELARTQRSTLRIVLLPLEVNRGPLSLFAGLVIKFELLKLRHGLRRPILPVRRHVVVIVGRPPVVGVVHASEFIDAGERRGQFLVEAWKVLGRRVVFHELVVLVGLLL